MERDQKNVDESHSTRTSLSVSKSGVNTSDSQQALPAFAPFFTVVENGETGEFYHPTVHYIFDDDDSSLLTSTAIDTLEADKPTIPAHDTAQQIAIVDLDANGQKVVNVSSISKDWQAVRAELSQAPSWGSSPQNTSNGVMLKLSGKDIHESVHVDTGPTGDIGELLEKFDRELESLSDVMHTERTGND